MKTLIFALGALVVVASEKCSKVDLHSPVVEMQTGPCFGFCPVYKLTVLHSGLVRYEGIRFTEKTGLDSFQLTAAELKGLKSKVNEVDLWQYPDVIKTEVVDAPFTTMSAFRVENVKTVKGSIDRPAPLLELEEMLKTLAEAHGFQVKRGVNPNEIAPDHRREVIVKLKPGINAGNWIKQFTDIKLRLVRRISEENIWRVAYDATEVEGKTLVDMLKTMDGVLEVQLNQQVQDRN